MKKIFIQSSKKAYSNLVLKPFEVKNSLSKNIYKENTLLIFSNPRGGSTWLADILSEVPYSVLFWEPLHRGRLKEFENLNFYWHQPIPVNAEWVEAENCFKRLLNREILNYKILTSKNMLKFPFSTHYIFKFCYGNLLMEWLTTKFDILPIFLIRHPCAVITSQLAHPAWRHLVRGSIEYKIPSMPFKHVYLKYEEIFKSVRTIEEFLAATWCISVVNNLISVSNNVKWITVSYESLYVNYEQEVIRIFDRLNIPLPNNVMNKKFAISHTANAKSADRILKAKQLTSWQDSLSKRQQENIFRIVNEFGLSEFYTREVVPNYDLVYNQ